MTAKASSRVALQQRAITGVIVLTLRDTPETALCRWIERRKSDRRGHRCQLRSASRQQRGKDAVHGALAGRPRQNSEALLPMPIGYEINVSGLVRHRDHAVLGEGTIDTLGFAKCQTRLSIIPADVGPIGRNRRALAEGWDQRQVGSLQPTNLRARIIPEFVGSYRRSVGWTSRGIDGRGPQRHAQCVFETNQGCERKRATTRQNFFQRGDADARVIRQSLTGYSAPRQFFANAGDDTVDIIIGKGAVGHGRNAWNLWNHIAGWLTYPHTTGQDEGNGI